MRNRYVAVFLFAILLGITVIGCGKKDKEAIVADKETKSEKSSEDNGVIELRVWSEATNNDLLNKMIDSFKEEYKDEAEFEIILDEPGSVAATKDAVLADVHNAADIFSFADDQLSDMAAAGALEPVPNAEEIKEANLKDAVSAASINDILYAYPMTADNGYFLYYNKDYLTEEDVKTLDGILSVAEREGKKISMDWSAGWYLYSFFGNTGLEIGVNDDGVTNYCNWNSTEGKIKGVDIAQALLNISSSPAFVSATDSEVLEKIQSGELIACVSGVWYEVEVRNAWGDDYGAVKLPTYTVADQQIQMASFTGYKMFGVNYYSKNKDWALKLADWFTNEQNQTLRLKERSQGPSNINASESDYMNNIPALQAVIAQSEFGNLQRVGNSYWAPCTEFGGIMANGNPDNKDLQELMDTLVAGITASVAQ